MKLFQSKLSVTEFGVADVVGSHVGHDAVIVACRASALTVVAPSDVFDGLPIGSMCRVEIHSLDPEPWPTERPEGWGVGCWCEYEQRKCDGRKLRGIVALTEHDPYYDVIVPSELFTDCIHVDQITGYGPRAEAGG